MTQVNTSLMIGLCLALAIVVAAPSASACLDLMPRTTTVDQTMYAVGDTTWEARTLVLACADGVTTAGSLDACA